jgi:hypothetical protein
MRREGSGVQRGGGRFLQLFGAGSEAARRPPPPLTPPPPPLCAPQLQRRGHGACEGLTIQDPGLLEFVMEAREEVESAAGPARLGALCDAAAARAARAAGALGAAVAGGDWAGAAQALTELRYLVRIQEAAEQKM